MHLDVVWSLSTEDIYILVLADDSPRVLGDVGCEVSLGEG